MNLSTRLDYLGPANLCLRLRRTARPALRPLRNSPERRPPLWTGHFSVFAGLEFPTRNGRSKAKRPVRHRFAPIRLKSTFEALRREGSDFTDLQFALAGHVCATRTLNAVRVRRPGKSERLHPTGNAPPSHHSSVTLNLVPVSVRLSQFRPSALAGPVRRTWVRVLTPEPSRVKSESADGAE